MSSSWFPKRIVTGGGSAGGHIAVLASRNNELNDPQDPPGFDASVVACLLFNPAVAISEQDPPSVQAIRFVEADMAPAILFFGSQDHTWKPGADEWFAKLRQSGNSASELWVAEGESHGFFNRQPWLDVCLIECDRFLVQHGLLTGKTTLVAPADGKPLRKGF